MSPKRSSYRWLASISLPCALVTVALGCGSGPGPRPGPRPGPGPGTAPVETDGVLDLGEVQPNATVRFVVKPGVSGFTFVLTNPDPLSGPRLTRLTGPSGPVVTDGTMAGKILDVRGFTLTAFAPEKATTVVAGEWEVVVRSGGRARVELRQAPPKPTSRPALALDVFVL